MSAGSAKTVRSARTCLLLLCALCCQLLCAPAIADDDATNTSACLMIESAANSNGLPVGFFTRLIWRESRFNPDAIGPVTRSGQRAQGIAQFMPKTAAERNLPDPFNPVQALPKAASLLSDLREEFGNLGLAAAAYNAGPQRIHDWLAGSRTMPAETERYVFAITGRSSGPMQRQAKISLSPSIACRPSPSCRTYQTHLPAFSESELPRTRSARGP